MHAIRTEAFLPASPDKVWAVLAGFDRYSAWNPLNTWASGKAESGARIPMTFVNPARPGSPIQMTVTVTRCESGRALEWIGRIPLLFTGKHRFELTPDGAGTRLLHGEDISGLIAWSISAQTIREKFVPAYEALNEALAVQLARPRL